MATLDPRIKIRHLQCFLEVARFGQVGRAAEQLHVTQPAVSKTLKELEQALKTRLFARTPRGLVLTPAGERFHDHAATGIVALQQAVESVRQERALPETSLRIGALPTVAARLLPAAVEELVATRSDAVVDLVSGPNRFLLERLKSRELDLVVGRLADPDSMVGLAFEQLYSECMSVVVRPGHPLLVEPVPEPAAIARFPLLLPGERDITRPLVDRWLLANRVPPPVRRIETVSSDFARAFLARTDAVWIISQGVVARELAAGGLVALPFDTAITAGPVGMTMRAGERPAPILALFTAIVRRRAAALREPDPARGADT
ncbi:MAG: pca operon transcription factor PcaQ [Geminicoccaceae bacterium]|nr:pca operon transcription factor PcaQ [Geminicoccaceae bacterium]MCX8102201.1 pca operon transcription factor PcaQ [Geminicoccaceae bacterium]MDW8368811.1 pca operon transcription factor PcaQ [Geminicoccaceae bacterium]